MTYKVIPLVETDDRAMQIDASRLMFMPDVQGLLQTYRPEGEKLTLAARLNGKVNTAFPEGRPAVEKSEQSGKPDVEKESREQPHLAESTEPINVIVVADTDMLQDRFWVQTQQFLGQRIAIPLSANNSFVTNALDNLTGSHDLISVRNRGSYSRPFTPGSSDPTGSRAAIPAERASSATTPEGHRTEDSGVAEQERRSNHRHFERRTAGRA